MYVSTLAPYFSQAVVLTIAGCVIFWEQVAVPYVHERKQFGVSVGTFQLMQAKIADIYTKLSASRAYVYSVGRGTCRLSVFLAFPNRIES